MKKPCVILPLVILLCLTFDCQQAEEVAEEPAVDIAVDIEAIKELSDAYGATISAGDVDGYINLFTDDAILMPPNAKIVIGKDKILLRAQARFGNYKDIGLEEVTTPEEIKIFGDWAFDRGFTSFKSRVNPTVRTNKFIRIWYKESNGSWKLARVIWNKNVPPPASQENQ